jgi:hypothetical protein
MFRMRRVFAVVVASGALAAGVAAPASAQPTNQDGLVNVAVVDVLNNNNVFANVQVPVGIAANICNVDVNVLARQRQEQGTRTCNSAVENQAAAEALVRQLPAGFQP